MYLGWLIHFAVERAQDVMAVMVLNLYSCVNRCLVFILPFDTLIHSGLQIAGIV